MTVQTPMPLEEFVKLSVWQVARLPMDELKGIQEEARDQKRKASACEDLIQKALAFKYADELFTRKAELIAAERRWRFGPHIRFQDDGHEICVTFPKTESWDQSKRRYLVDALTACDQDPHEYMEFSYSISPETYCAASPQIQAILDAAIKVEKNSPTFDIWKVRGS